MGNYRVVILDFETTGRLWISMVDDLKSDYLFKTVSFELMQRLTKVSKSNASTFLNRSAEKQK